VSAHGANARSARLVRAAAALLAAALAAAACTPTFRSSAKPEQIYYLRAPAPAAGSGVAPPPASAPSIRVLTPLAAPGLDTTHIILVQADHRMSFFAASRWPGRLPEVVETLAVQTLRGSRAWSAVMDSASPFPSDYMLRISVRRFEADYSAGALPVVHVVLDCSVGRRVGRDLLASFSAAGEAPAAADRMSEVVGAFEQAAGAALQSLSQQTQAVVHADAAARPASER
jgi:cholesterol transport system auxiliary component